ncbi:MAG: hypothetical protein HEQ29_13225 [Dolichospermum sp. LBC05a]|nr:hypothetical protein [Dolichospermum sp. OL01]MCO5797689.1 hypothetical protein [Dolichospermum sp. OL03]MCS6282630.1 hypothetical protein [Dolichospermum sp.]QSV59193.1 MAG: hypothetical protein HEQ29_13225 [Dolichospermum sp. LBC05a]
MSSISINIGDVFSIDTPPNGQHFYVVIAKTSGNKYLFVNLTDKKNNFERVCVLAPDPSVPSFIKKESVIAYYFTREMDANDLAICITSSSPIPKDCLSADIVLQIQQGGLISKKLKNKYKTALKEFLGID